MKSEQRALQKVYRSYGGVWQRLSDLVRVSVVCGTFRGVRACLEALAADTEVRER